ncbi:MAG: DNA methylase [Spirochaetes bacterium RBG_16_49_21]|nr:MAG: DNA methylase [Spirochaetes bacterium RBG_16_49_21]
MPKPKLKLETTTLWDYPSQHYSKKLEYLHKGFEGATPAYIIWNLLQRHTRPKDLVVDPMCGSGTTLDVARELGRRALGYDLAPVRKDIFRADARTLPLEDGKADFVFVDPPYSTHIRYSGLPECIGELSARGEEYFTAMREVIAEIHRILRNNRYMGLYVSDSFEKGKPFTPIGFRLFSIMEEFFIPVDIIAVKRHNVNLGKRHWHSAAIKHNYFLRGFHYLFIMYKAKDKKKIELPDRRDPDEVIENQA